MKLMIFIIASLLFLAAVSLPASAATCANATAVFAFGDGFFDSGNNNHISTLCRYNHAPYGMNLPEHKATGRFSDGELPADILLSGLGLKKSMPAFLDPGLTDDELLTGASFASACSGYDEVTSKQACALSLAVQVSNFQQAVGRIEKKVGQKDAAALIQNSLYFISGGTHDMLNNFYLLPSKRLTTLAKFFKLMLGNVEILIKRVHSLGGMNFAVLGMPPVGCTPIDVTAGSVGSERVCVDKHNKDVKDFNNRLKALTQDLQIKLAKTKIVYIDIYSPIMQLVNNPDMASDLKGCCGSGLVEVGPLCNAMSTVCEDPSKFVFWDAVNPSKATITVLAKQLQQQVVSTLLS